MEDSFNSISFHHPLGHGLLQLGTLDHPMANKRDICGYNIYIYIYIHLVINPIVNVVIWMW